MQYNFYQERLFEKRYFKFTETGLFIHSQSFFKTHEYQRKYEDIGTHIIFSKKGNRTWLIPTVILLFVSLILFVDKLYGGDVEKGAELFYLIPALVCLAGYILTYERACYLVKSNNANAIKFLIAKPSDEKLDEFLKEVLSKRKQYLLEMYGKINRNLTYENQNNNLTWLRENAVLTDEEFQLKKAELDQYLPQNIVVSGFFSAPKNAL